MLLILVLVFFELRRFAQTVGGINIAVINRAIRFLLKLRLRLGFRLRLCNVLGLIFFFGIFENRHDLLGCIGFKLTGRLCFNIRRILLTVLRDRRLLVFGFERLCAVNIGRGLLYILIAVKADNHSAVFTKARARLKLMSAI